MFLDYITGDPSYVCVSNDFYFSQRNGYQQRKRIPDSILVRTIDTSETVGQRDWLKGSLMIERPARGRVVTKLSQGFACEHFCTSSSLLLTVINPLLAHATFSNVAF
jgi:hypothetical protein